MADSDNDEGSLSDGEILSDVDERNVVTTIPTFLSPPARVVTSKTEPKQEAAAAAALVRKKHDPPLQLTPPTSRGSSIEIEETEEGEEADEDDNSSVGEDNDDKSALVLGMGGGDTEENDDQSDATEVGDELDAFGCAVNAAADGSNNAAEKSNKDTDSIEVENCDKSGVGSTVFPVVVSRKRAFEDTELATCAVSDAKTANLSNPPPPPPPVNEEEKESNYSVSVGADSIEEDLEEDNSNEDDDDVSINHCDKESEICPFKLQSSETVASIDCKSTPPSSNTNYTCTSLDLPKQHMRLPPGWKSIIHNTGIPIYFHKQTSVATFARPFVLEKGETIRTKEAPLSSVPCLEYRYYLESKKNMVSLDEKDKEARIKELSSTANATLSLSTSANRGQKKGPEAKEDDSTAITAGAGTTENVVIGEAAKGDKAKENVCVSVMKNVPSNISNTLMQEYLEPLFVVRERRPLAAHRAKKQFIKKARERVVKKNELGVPLLIKNGDRYENIRLLEANHTTRTYITVLNDYCTKALKTTPVYNCSNVLAPACVAPTDTANSHSSDITTTTTNQSSQSNTNSTSQTQCVVTILNVKYGEAIAVGKRQAKNLAAKQALRILCPEVLRSADGSEQDDDTLTSSLTYKLRIIEIFKRFQIGDTAVVEELKVREASNFAPLQLLNQFLIRNLSPSELKLHTNFVSVRDPKTNLNQHECELKLGSKYSAKAIAKTQNTASQLAALKLLEELHPSLIYYSSLIRLYGIDPSEIQAQKEKLIREEVAQSQEPDACDTILRLLREEMKKVSAEKEANSDKKKEVVDTLKISPDEPEYFYTKLWQFDKN